VAILKAGFRADHDEAEAKAEAEAQFRDMYPDAGEVTVSVIRTDDHDAAGEFLVRVENVIPMPDLDDRPPDRTVI
jgi:hypothetical protein